jgi:hypothetical protein
VKREPSDRAAADADRCRRELRRRAGPARRVADPAPRRAAGWWVPTAPARPPAAPAARPGAGQRRRAHPVDGRPLVAAMLFQHPFLMHLSVFRNVTLSLWLRGVPAADGRRGPGGAAPRRPGRAGRPAGAVPVRRPAAAPGAGAGLGPAARRALPRRTHRQPRPERQARGRAADCRPRRRRRDDGDEHAQPRPGQAPVLRAWPTWRRGASWSTCQWTVSSTTNCRPRRRNSSRVNYLGAEGPQPGRLQAPGPSSATRGHAGGRSARTQPGRLQVAGPSSATRGDAGGRSARTQPTLSSAKAGLRPS